MVSTEDVDDKHEHNQSEQHKGRARGAQVASDADEIAGCCRWHDECDTATLLGITVVYRQHFF